jgi:hypothetical protein
VTRWRQEDSVELRSTVPAEAGSHFFDHLTESEAGFDFGSTVFLEQVGRVAGQAGTGQAFVYRSSVRFASNQNLAPAPEPGTTLPAGCGLLSLLATRVLRRFSQH